MKHHITSTQANRLIAFKARLDATLEEYDSVAPVELGRKILRFLDNEAKIDTGALLADLVASTRQPFPVAPHQSLSED